MLTVAPPPPAGWRVPLAVLRFPQNKPRPCFTLRAAMLLILRFDFSAPNLTFVGFAFGHGDP